MDRCTGHNNIIEILLKIVLKTIQSINHMQHIAMRIAIWVSHMQYFAIRFLPYYFTPRNSPFFELASNGKFSISF